MGYARVSTVGQTLAAQLDQLEAAGCEVFFAGEGLRCARRSQTAGETLKGLREGNLVVVTRTDHLARSNFQMFRMVSQIVNAGANFRDLAQPLADTSTSLGRMYLAILCGLAEIERELIAGRPKVAPARRSAWDGRSN